MVFYFRSQELLHHRNRHEHGLPLDGIPDDKMGESDEEKWGGVLYVGDAQVVTTPLISDCLASKSTCDCSPACI